MALMAGLGPDDQNKLINVEARKAIKARQITFSFTLGCSIAPGIVSQAKLVDKVKTALATISTNDTPELTLKLINRHHNSNAILELTSDTAADYLCRTDVRRAFAEALDPRITVRDNAYTVMFLFVPVTFNPSSSTTIQELENKNGWKTGTIHSLWWAKPPERRANTQQYAHVIATLTDPAIANIAIRDGFTLNHYKFQAKKNRKEPI